MPNLLQAHLSCDQVRVRAAPQEIETNLQMLDRLGGAASTSSFQRKPELPKLGAGLLSVKPQHQCKSPMRQLTEQLLHAEVNELSGNRMLPAVSCEPFSCLWEAFDRVVHSQLGQSFFAAIGMLAPTQKAACAQRDCCTASFVFESRIRMCLLLACNLLIVVDADVHSYNSSLSIICSCLQALKTSINMVQNKTKLWIAVLPCLAAVSAANATSLQDASALATPPLRATTPGPGPSASRSPGILENVAILGMPCVGLVHALHLLCLPPVILLIILVQRWLGRLQGPAATAISDLTGAVTNNSSTSKGCNAGS